MSTIIDDIERSQRRSGIPNFGPGDRVRVHFQVIEGTRRRTQVFEGIVIKRQGSGIRETFTVRKQSFGVGVERTFPVHSPKIETLEVASRGAVRRAKLYYLRGRVGKAARVAERRWGIDEKLVIEPAASDGAATDAEGVSQDDVVPVAEETDNATSESTEESTDDATEEGGAPEAEETAEGFPEAEAPEEAGDAGEDSGEDPA